MSIFALMFMASLGLGALAFNLFDDDDDTSQKKKTLKMAPMMMMSFLAAR